MKFLLTGMIGLLLAATASAQFVQTPWGPAWIGDPAKRPAEPVIVVPPAPPPFRPAFENATFSFIVNGQTVSGPMNADYFATAATAEAICRRFACLFVFEQPSGGAGGPFAVSRQERWLRFDSFIVNAGLLAAFYKPDRNPEDKFPGLADKLIRIELEKRKLQ